MEISHTGVALKIFRHGVELQGGILIYILHEARTYNYLIDIHLYNSVQETGKKKLKA